MAMEDIMAEIDVDELRDYMEDYCGTAAAAGFDTAVFDLADIDDANGYELCEKAEELGFDLEQFIIDD